MGVHVCVCMCACMHVQACPSRKGESLLSAAAHSLPVRGNAWSDESEVALPPLGIVLAMAGQVAVQEALVENTEGLAWQPPLATYVTEAPAGKATGSRRACKRVCVWRLYACVCMYACECTLVPRKTTQASPTRCGGTGGCDVGMQVVLFLSLSLSHTHSLSPHLPRLYIPASRVT